eukprot:scaffold273423_cov22-Prasinocladus_malaysianus.AAC.1
MIDDRIHEAGDICPYNSRQASSQSSIPRVATLISLWVSYIIMPSQPLPAGSSASDGLACSQAFRRAIPSLLTECQ